MPKSQYIHKSHIVSVLLYHFMFLAKYRKAVFSKALDCKLKEISLKISKRYEIHFLEIGKDKDYVHLLVQIVPTYNATIIVTIMKSITAREIFKNLPEVKVQQI